MRRIVRYREISKARVFFFFFYSFPIALKFGSRLSGYAVGDLVKFQSDAIVLTFSSVGRDFARS